MSSMALDFNHRRRTSPRLLRIERFVDPLTMLFNVTVQTNMGQDLWGLPYDSMTMYFGKGIPGPGDSRHQGYRWSVIGDLGASATPERLCEALNYLVDVSTTNVSSEWAQYCSDMLEQAAPEVDTWAKYSVHNDTHWSFDPPTQLVRMTIHELDNDGDPIDSANPMVSDWVTIWKGIELIKTSSNYSGSLKESIAEMDAGIGDSIDADALLQFGLFGKYQYG